MIKLICLTCKKDFEVHFCRRNIAKYCSSICYHNSQKNKPIPWLKFNSIKGVWNNTGRTHFKKERKASIEIKNNKGYILIWNPKHPNSRDGRIKRANLVMEKCLGRYLNKEEMVHHINLKRDDDRIDNLQLYTNKKEHMSFHKRKKI